MLLTVNTDNAPILSNISEVGSFRIRSSAKAFRILSDGLYPNKIRAVIREISCNAVDSHVAAGFPTRPITVHLPSSFEPWFSVIDTGLGLDHNEFKSVYTEYFNSTKTDSNEMIGALGLGSKSPFCYTDNFTVTCVKHGNKRIYSMFINAGGEPDWALMTECDTSDPNGVEVKLSVNNTSDFSRFSEEASTIFSYFKVKPIVVGGNYNPVVIEYNTVDLLPGVSVRKTDYNSRHRGKSFAIMGNIAYPLEVPNANSVLGDLANYLKENLDICFNIGELDIQASREGLSYIPETIAAIKAKLQGIGDVLDKNLSDRADAIENFWGRCDFLKEQSEINIWISSVKNYVANSDCPLLDPKIQWSNIFRAFKNPTFTNTLLASKYNIVLQIYEKNWKKSYTGVGNYTDKPDFEQSILVNQNGLIIVDDLPRGMQTRLKHNFDAISTKHQAQMLYVLTAAVKDQPILYNEFIKDIYNYPNMILGSSLEPAPKKVATTHAKVTFLKLKQGQHYRSNGFEMVWSNEGDQIGSLDPNTQYYFVELKNFIVQTKFSFTSFKEYYSFFNLNMSGMIPSTDKIIAVRGETSVNLLKQMPNFTLMDDYITTMFERQKANIIQSIALLTIDKNKSFFRSDPKRSSTLFDKVIETLPSESNFVKLWVELKPALTSSFAAASVTGLLNLVNAVDPTTNTEIKDQVNKVTGLFSKYSMLNIIDKNIWSSYSYNTSDVANTFVEYINLVDNHQKGKN